MQIRLAFRSFARLGSAGLCVVAMCASAQAQAPTPEAGGSPRLERWEFGVLPTWRKLSGEVMGDHVWGMGATLAAEYRVTGPIGLQAAFTGAFNPQLNFQDQATLNELSASLSAVARPRESGPWTPYAVLGVMMERFRIVEPPAGMQARSAFIAPHLGAGVRYQLNHWLAWRTELNTQIRNGGASLGAHSGVSFRFARRPAEPPPPAPRTIVVVDTVTLRDTVRLVERFTVTVTDTLRLTDTVVVRELHNVERVLPGEKLILTLKDANFDFAKWTLRPEASPPLDSLAAQLIAAGGAVRIKVVGHTDHVGSHAANRTLGMARAIAVRDHLSRLGVPANLVDVRTEGEESPIATNETEAGRQLNRRVVIWSVP
jgi:outer membrane protein OmpA-like peptidoglycan-associated protein